MRGYIFARHLVSFVFLLPTYLRKGAFESVGALDSFGRAAFEGVAKA